MTGSRARVVNAGQTAARHHRVGFTRIGHRLIGCCVIGSGVIAFSPIGCADGSEPDPSGGGGSSAGGSSSSAECPSDLPDGEACDSRVPSYQLDVAPIVDRRCGGCHYPGNASGDVFVEQADLYARRQTVLTRIYACAMPPEGAAPLTAEERQVLLEWFVCGAPDN